MDYFFGKNLYGDNFTIDEIEQRYKDEEEAYANMYDISNMYTLL